MELGRPAHDETDTLQVLDIAIGMGMGLITQCFGRRHIGRITSPIHMGLQLLSCLGELLKTYIMIMFGGILNLITSYFRVPRGYRGPDP